MLLKSSETLSGLVGAKYKTAKLASDLLFSHTDVTTIHTTTGIPACFQLRYCPALAKKPIVQNNVSSKKIDPFESPSPGLYIADIPASNPSHLLVLNKYPVIAEHFIIATKSNKKQTLRLERDDLEATYACLKAWRDGPQNKQSRLFAFFNSGEHSGASQPHRHLQFLPVERLRSDAVAGDWGLLIDLVLSSGKANVEDSSLDIIQHPGIPFVHFASSFDTEPSGADLLSLYNKLLKEASAAADAYSIEDTGNFVLHDETDGDSPISYNLAMTLEGMMIVPRRTEGARLRRNDGSEFGYVALNGTVLGGTMMVKLEEEWHALREEPEQLDQLLTSIGIPI